MASDPLLSCCTRPFNSSGWSFLVHSMTGGGSASEIGQSSKTRSDRLTAWLALSSSTLGGTIHTHRQTDAITNFPMFPWD